jgi:glycogen operon protein
LQLVTDSLRYWVQEMHVDGFRFDLATTLAREEHGGFDVHSGFLDVVRQDPVLSHVKLIAEPWDVGPGGYRVGGFPPDWAEWNDKFRDTVRRFWKGEGGLVRELSGRMCASQDMFGHAGRRPWSSVNFVTAHDGFTLRDLVSYEHKHNEANGEGNRDGNDNNNSMNCGAEGPSDDPAVSALRARQQRNLLATLLLSQGVPMLLAGDELGNSQNGNNNAYCQDNAIGWVDWGGDQAKPGDLAAFVRHLIDLRRRYPSLRRERFLTGSLADQNGTLKDVTWLVPDGREKTEADWNYPDARSLCFLLAGAESGKGGEAGDPLLVVLNAHFEAMSYRVPPVAGIADWVCLLDTGAEVGARRKTPLPTDAKIEVEPRTVVMLRGRSASESAAPAA